jgi:hypothetical protein
VLRKDSSVDYSGNGRTSVQCNHTNSSKIGEFHYEEWRLLRCDDVWFV